MVSRDTKAVAAALVILAIGVSVPPPMTLSDRGSTFIASWHGGAGQCAGCAQAATAAELAEWCRFDSAWCGI